MYVCFVVDKAQQQILITKQQQTYVYKNIKMPLINQSFENKRKHNYSQQQIIIAEVEKETDIRTDKNKSWMGIKLKPIKFVVFCFQFYLYLLECLWGELWAPQQPDSSSFQKNLNYKKFTKQKP